MKNEKYIIAAALGVLSTFIAEIVSLILVATGIGHLDMYRVDSLFITLNRPSFFWGLIVEMVVGGAAAIIFYVLLDRFGAGFAVLKGAILSMFFWFLLKMYTTAFIEGTFVDFYPMDTYLNHLICTLIFGSTIGLLFRFILFKRKRG